MLYLLQVPLLEEPNPHSELVSRRQAILEEWKQRSIPKDSSLDALRELYQQRAPTPREMPIAPAAMSDTRRVFRQIFLPRNTNYAGNVFGGDFLQWMEVGCVFLSTFLSLFVSRMCGTFILLLTVV